MSSDGTIRTEERVHPITRFSGRVHAVLDTLADAPAWSMTADEQRDALLALTRAESRLGELRLRVLAAGHAADIGKADASPTTGAWLAGHTRQNRPAANADVRLATALDGPCAATREALATGRVNGEQAKVIVKAVTDGSATDSDTITACDRRRAELHLLDLADIHDAHDLAGFARHIFEVLDPETADEKLGKKLADEEREARRKTFLKLRDNGDGTTSGSFRIPALHGQMLTTALNAFTAPRRIGKSARHHSDGTPLNRIDLLGMGLCELIERYPLGRLPQAGGANATVVVTMTLEQLVTGLGTASVIDGKPISAGEARRLGCEAGFIPAVLGGESEILDLGRKRRTHSKAQRLAMTLRDKRCTTEHCDRPATWCEGHHDVIPWSGGGTTTVERGRLLCPWHHHRADDPNYEMTRLPNGKVRFTRRQ